ncbi:MAG TPA: hypothetical protein VJ793_13370 [Anaerolineae bacterium]|nr:hypothetical protein [Anaerolineae bacterium]
MIGYIILGALLAYFLAMFIHAELFARKVERKYPPLDEHHKANAGHRFLAR